MSTTHGRPRVDVMVCHDCCCGTDRKHPGLDHSSLRAQLLAADGQDGVRVRVVDCLDVCERSNVVLVRRHDRPRGERDTWLARILYPSQAQAVADWAGSAETAPPDALGRHVFHPHHQ